MATSNLLTPLTVGELRLPNRVVMAPLTRCRASGRVPNPLMATYYRQRAGAGLILSEATSVDPMGVGYPDTPGIWSAPQVAGWQAVTRAVHEAGGRIALQLWHVGRVSDPVYLDGALPVAPSALAPPGHLNLVRPQRPFVVPRPLREDEMPGVIAAFARGAALALEAGFDGVELHGANGYLLDQFLQDVSNVREDGYGGSIAARARLLLEVVDAVVAVWGRGRVGVHLAPRGDAFGMGDSDLAATFTYVAEALGQRRIAYLCARESLAEPRLGPRLRRAFGGVYIANEGLTPAAAEGLVAAGEADAAAFGKAFIANPDLVARLGHQAPLTAPRPELFYAPGAEGYTDYAAWAG